MSRIPRRGVVNPLDSGSGFGARDGTPVHLFLSIIRPSGVGAGSLFLPLAFCFVLDVDIRSFLINFTPLFCSALESSVLFPVASLTCIYIVYEISKGSNMFTKTCFKIYLDKYIFCQYIFLYLFATVFK